MVSFRSLRMGNMDAFIQIIAYWKYGWFHSDHCILEIHDWFHSDHCVLEMQSPIESLSSSLHSTKSLIGHSLDISNSPISAKAAKTSFKQS